MIAWTLLLGAASIAQADGSKTLDLFAGVNPQAIKVAAGARLVAPPAPATVPLRVDTDSSHPWPGIEIRPPAGQWDLSRFAYMDVDLNNPTEAEVPVSIRVDDPAGDGVLHSCNGRITLKPKSAGSVRVHLCGGKPDWIKVSLTGMNGYPWGVVHSWDKPGAGMIDRAHVTKVIVFVGHPKVEHTFEVVAMRAGGSYVPPTPLLADPDKFFPFIDTFGQYMHRDWPGKTHELADLAAARDREQQDLASHPGPASWDRFGGWKDGPTLKATGYFYTAKPDGKWWLVDPDGHLFFSQGIDCVRPGEDGTPVDGREKWFRDLPPDQGLFRKCYVKAYAVVHGDYTGQHPLCFNFAKANMIRKYGDTWPTAFADVSHRRLRNWGINTIGAWSSPEIYLNDKTPYAVEVGASGKFLEGSSGWWGKFRDVYDPSFGDSVRKAMAKETTSAKDPWCIGYFVDNELSWGGDGMSLALAALTSPADQPAKIAFVHDLQAKYGAIEHLNSAWGTAHASWAALQESKVAPDAKRAGADLQAFYSQFAHTYFRIVRDAVKEAAPNHLYLGCRFSAGNAGASAAAAEYCDVVSFNIYRRTPDAEPLPIQADKPILIGEFHLGALDRGMFHPGLVPVEDQAERGEVYKGYVQAALRNPRIVGCHWFKYGDEPTIGRSYDGENYQIGFVDITDTPYPEIIAAAREVAAHMYELRK